MWGKYDGAHLGALSMRYGILTVEIDMQSAWQKLTGGMCDAALADKPKAKQTARQLKDSMRGAVERAERKFDKLAALDAECTPESRKAKRKLSDNWTKREARNVSGFYDAKAVRALKRGAPC